ncbi:hypothetical protein [Aminobacter sp. HY435]|uniref:hypothetical protein n=1 Tax=Aminobacter sp. HY435 TaxID=2970917 RepID=UPI0022B9A1CF|nr:hypothetical protein [Aminobacter sp. HY435]
MDEEDPNAPDVEAGEFDRLMGMSVEDILREGQKALFANLVGKVRSGKANHQEKAILRNILKDNGLTLGIPPDAPREEVAPLDLPDFETPNYG